MRGLSFMDDGFKLSFVSNVEERIEIVLNSLNNGTNIQDTNATEVLKLFEPHFQQAILHFHLLRNRKPHCRLLPLQGFQVM